MAIEKMTPHILNPEEFKQSFFDVAYTLAVHYKRLNADLLTDVLPNTNIRCKAVLSVDIIKEKEGD